MGELVQFPANDLRHYLLGNFAESNGPAEVINVTAFDSLRQQRHFAAHLGMICRQSSQLRRQSCEVRKRAEAILAARSNQDSPSSVAVPDNRTGGRNVCPADTARSPNVL